MAESSEGAQGAFTISDLWKPSIFTIESEDVLERPLHQFGLDSKDSFTFGDLLTDNQLHATFQDLNTFQYGALDEIPQPESVTAPSDLESLELDNENDDEDIWLDALKDTADEAPPVDKSWESFYDATFVEPARYLSDLGSEAVDAVVAKTALPQFNAGSRLHVFQQQPSVFALRSLGLGYSSWLFQAPSSKDGLTINFRPMTISGLTPKLTEAVAESFMVIGAQCKDLRAYTEQCYGSKHPSSPLLAFASVLSDILDRILFRMSEGSMCAHSLLEVHLTYQKPAQILKILLKLTTLMGNSRSAMEVLTVVFEFVREHELDHSWTRPLLLAVLDRTSRPWLDAMSWCLGLDKTSLCDRRLVSKIQTQAKDSAEGWADAEDGTVIPSFISKHVTRVMLETCNTITLLTEHNRSAALHSDGLEKLKWIFSNLNSQTSFNSDIKPSMNPYGSTGITIRDQFETLAAVMEHLPANNNGEIHDDLGEVVRASFILDSPQEMAAFSCPLSLTPDLSFANTIEKQHRSVGRVCLRMLFREHGFREHITLQRRYHLFGDGLFAARLSQALFSSHLSTINGRRDYSQTGDFGLRLGDRSVWPPGGSELRLVLMGILSESYYGSYSAIGGGGQELPGNLSFGIRHLSEPEIAAIMDPNSLTALDFLRLQYTASSPVNAVLTEAALDKYDAIFKLLLRVSRLLALTSQMAPRRNQREDAISARFRIIVTRFMEALSGYFFQSAIAQPWARFEARVVDLEVSLEDDHTELGGQISSVLELRMAHDAMLDVVLFGLLLRNRQAPVMQLLEEIFELILQFAQLKDDSSNQQHISKLFSAFRTKVRTFVSVCRGLSGKKSYIVGAGKDGVGLGEGSGIDQLVLRLDMNGWWTNQG